MAARRDGSIFHLKSWKVDETEQVHQELSFQSNLESEIPLLKFDVNGNFLIIENVQGEVELWSIRNTVPKQISLPNCDSFLNGEYERSLDCRWVLGEGEEVLVALFSIDCEAIGCQYKRFGKPCDQYKFGLVFKHFTLQNYVFRITFPKKDHVVSIQLTKIEVANDQFKTLLVAGCSKDAPQELYHHRHYYHLYDLSTGKLVETLSNNGCKSLISGSYVFPNDIWCKDYRPGVNISRINWNGSSWSISTHFITFPNNISDEHQLVAISNVTDTLVIWNLVRTTSIVVCDYLL